MSQTRMIASIVLEGARVLSWRGFFNLNMAVLGYECFENGDVESEDRQEGRQTKRIRRSGFRRAHPTHKDYGYEPGSYPVEEGCS